MVQMVIKETARKSRLEIFWWKTIRNRVVDSLSTLKLQLRKGNWKMNYRMRYKECYEGYYEIEADSKLEAEKKLIRAIATGSENAPEILFDRGVEVVAESVERD